MHFFNYQLPEHLIAQHPVACRDESRLLVLRRGSGELEHRIFRDLPELLSPGDLLVLNDTRVLPARLLGHREKSGGKWECLFLKRHDNGLWELLAKTRGHPNTGEAFVVNDAFRLILRGRTGDSHWLMEPELPGEPEDLLARFGTIPLPPYIRQGRSQEGDAERYQTVFAEKLGSVAAPTAGLHFTPELFERLKQRGIETARATLHVGLGTFAPMKADDPAKHAIHHEWCELSPSECDAIRQCQERGGRVVAVGTTATRTLETAAAGGTIQPFRGETDLFIRPPFQFQIVNALITNFHLPKTTLLLLVGAFAGGDFLQRAYEVAIRKEFRFYSYGDAMIVL